jgi:hypothetical protein
LALVVLLVAGPSTTTQAAPVTVNKVEGLMKYGQNIMHGPLVGTHTHVLTPLPAVFWDSPVTLIGTVGPDADAITATHSARHKVAPHGGEAVPGPTWVAPSITPAVGGVGAITIAGASGTRDHGHTDYFNHMMAVLWGVGGRIVGYAYASSAAHDPVSCSAKSAALRGSEESPPAHSQACGAASLIFDAGTNTFVIAVSAFGIAHNNLLSAAIHVGNPGENGPVIFDLGPPSQWADNPGMGIDRVVQDSPFPVAFVPDLMAGRLYVNIKTTAFPQGEVRGQLADAPVVGVPGAGSTLVFGLDGVRPNPTLGRELVVQFTLPVGEPAQLELLDVQGRRVTARQVGALGVGRHAIDLAEGRRIPPGVYMVRLTQGVHVRVRRVVVLE